MSLTKRLDELVRACFTGIWVTTHEPHEAITEIANLCRQEQWQCASWNVASGLAVGGQDVPQDATDPLAALRAADAIGSEDQTKILILENFHRFLQSAEIVQAMAKQVLAGKQSRTILIVLAPVVQIPVELEKLMVVVDHELPDRQQLKKIAEEIAVEPGELPDAAELERVLDAAVGLTRIEAENAFSLSLIRESCLAPETLWQQKSQMLTKSGLLKLYRGTDDFSQLGGLDSLKRFTKRALLQPCRSNPLRRPRGVMLLSPPGCGKSAFCKALGKETGRPVLQLDVGCLMGSLVGSTEERTRLALAIADAMAPAILMVDEVEKAFAGSSNGGQNDGGVSSRMLGSFLGWLNDHETDVFVVCTSNNIRQLPPEFSRSERFDGVFFVDLPSREAKDSIWAMYLALFELDATQRLPDDNDWSGAEIRACCRLAALLDMPVVQSAQNVVPVAVTSSESVDALRQWASGRCLDADRPGVYTASSPKTSNGKRRLARSRPSNN
ncbi:ATP-dependent zinc metalloprotease FtsH 2 [Novipirellula aureliae]|uniref:Uncharacterized AAA domain-containing protein ycf46 n=1 Tax=Novipirellula aureliae TaxID=2527966 RepID=A0A5C6DDY0_9BACT|nr:AAA family ATPase [Novipirellula aureliae]TWU33426.1 ATP-dependent zinc metalloprotease FtsH 2 [Novipirellula aureliae]